MRLLLPVGEAGGGLAAQNEAEGGLVTHGG